MAQRFLRSGIGRLVPALLLLAIAPAMLLLWQMAAAARGEPLRQAAIQQRAAAGFGVALFEDLLAGAGRAMAAAGTDATGWAARSEACAARLRQFAEAHPLVTDPALLRRDGRLICSGRGGGGDAQPGDRPYLAEALQTGRLVVGAAEVSRRAGRAVVPIAQRLAATPAVAGEEAPMLLVAALDLGWLATVLAGAADGTGREVMIVDRAGGVLALWPAAGPAPPADHPLIRAVLAAPHGTTEVEGPDGRPRVVGFAHAPSAGIAIAVSVARDALAGAADRRFLLALGLIALAGAAGVGLAAALARRLIGRPLVALAAAAEAAPGGAALAALPAPPMAGEIATLKAALARLAGGIAAREAALAAAHAELEAAGAQLAELAERDALTGLANRRAFDAALAAAWSRGRREAAPVALLILDIDHFRPFNDRYGRIEGDACLARLAGMLAGLMLRPYDLAARLGGEEFALLMPDSDLVGAVAVGERIRAALHDMMLLHEGSPHGFVTASIGAASMVPAGPVEARVLLAAADRALRAAKAAGRDRVSAAGYAAAA